MKIKNFEVQILANVLFNMSLVKKDSRMRTRFVKELGEYLKSTLDIEQQELIKTYAKKDDDGEPLLNEDKTSAILIEETADEFHKEFDQLMNEEYIIVENESSRDMLITVGKSLLDCELEFKGQEATLFDGWCEQFEELIEQYESKEES